MEIPSNVVMSYIVWRERVEIPANAVMSYIVWRERVEIPTNAVMSYNSVERESGDPYQCCNELYSVGREREEIPINAVMSYIVWRESGDPCQCRNCSQGPPAEKTGRGSLLNRPSCPPPPPRRPNRSRD